MTDGGSNPPPPAPNSPPPAPRGQLPSNPPTPQTDTNASRNNQPLQINGTATPQQTNTTAPAQNATQLADPASLKCSRRPVSGLNIADYSADVIVLSYPDAAFVGCVFTNVTSSGVSTTSWTCSSQTISSNSSCTGCNAALSEWTDPDSDKRARASEWWKPEGVLVMKPVKQTMADLGDGMLHGCLYENLNATKPMACSVVIVTDTTETNAALATKFSRCSHSTTTATTLDIGAFFGAAIAILLLSMGILALYLRRYRHRYSDPDSGSSTPSFFGVFRRFSDKKKRTSYADRLTNPTDFGNSEAFLLARTEIHAANGSALEPVHASFDSVPPTYTSDAGNAGPSNHGPPYLAIPAPSSAMPPYLLQDRSRGPAVASTALPRISDSESHFPSIARSYPTRLTAFLPESKFKLHGNRTVDEIPSLEPTTSNLLSCDSNQKMVDEWQAVFSATQLAVTAWLPTGTLSGRVAMTRPHSRAIAMSVVAQFIAGWLDYLVEDALAESMIQAYGRVAERVPLPVADSVVEVTMTALDKLDWTAVPIDRGASRAKMAAIFRTVAATWCRMRCADMTMAAYTALSKADFDGALMKDGATLTNSSSTDFEKLVVAACMFPGIVHRTFDGQPSLLSPVVVMTDVSTGLHNVLPAI
ncbi:hypothetical protein AMAG_14753 [Allomyces macrogynus ATCC 38327]|uniref:Uncharacterized protein n=1 Tax=Allomyces macrogynus (strain ATCC 38327) TaxID=578462 RepID=A0A0L0T581_ALLM3|nr:hypothetical protein AMAG_14753 [Allomyces macrogynus ATCC 38327]|eukprot:KNE69905.1 hypothetical protein AMAG_14753 [Allomyces macrogynus ATCC 38327]